MKKEKFLFLIILFYVITGTIHFIRPGIYLNIMPEWLPAKVFFIYLSGSFEIILGLSLINAKLRPWAAYGIIIMLFIFLFLIHIPLTMHYYKTDPKAFTFWMARNPIQLLLIYWAYIYTK